MKEIVELSAGDLYRTSSENLITGIYNEQCELISKLMPRSAVLLIDNRYFHTV